MHGFNFFIRECSSVSVIFWNCLHRHAISDYVLNDNPIIRTLETAVDGVGHLVDENAVSVEVNLQAEWGEAHTSWGGVECPSDLCYVSVLVEAGVIVELREIYQS